MKTPQFLRALMSAPAYMDKNSKAYAAAEKYLNLLYPGVTQIDATGRMRDPEYDMTLKQFNKAQDELEAVLEEAKQEAAAEIEAETGEVIDEEELDKYIELEETIEVRVLMPSGGIENMQLEVYTLNLPEDDGDTPNGKAQHVWRWHSEDSDNTCDECASRDGAVYESEDDVPEIPVHPNCRCSITEDVIGPDGKTLSSKPYSPKKPAVVPDAPEKTASTPAEKATFSKPVNTKPGYYAVFDGKKFTLYVDSKPVISLDAVSGKKGFQSPEYQSEKDKGPIPAGTYVARQEELQFINTRDAILGVAAILDIKKGGWPGSYYSWGNSRVWLEPSKETNTYGRDKFSIHGGWNPGSIGCIDLTSQMQNFVALFEFVGKDLIVEVRY